VAARAGIAETRSAPLHPARQFHPATRASGNRAEPIEGSTALELTWTFIPLGIFIFIFVWSAAIFFRERTPPKDSTEVYTVAKQWMWKFQHIEGQREINELHVPVGRDVRMIMTSQDVIHSFYVPAFRIKQDVLPGRYTTAWFRATKPGTYHLFCAEYCGTMHSGMVGDVVVMEPAQYQTWLSGGAAAGSLSNTGQGLFQSLGCSTCHRLDTQGRGPNLTGVFGKPVLLEDGRTLDVANVIWCAGFDHGFDWIHLPVFDEDGEVVHRSSVVPDQPGLYFVGLMFLHAMSSSMIQGVGRDAKRIVDTINQRIDETAAKVEPLAITR